jgi:hypothetical protein
LHFCLNSSAINIYLDMYWVEVFSTNMKWAILWSASIFSCNLFFAPTTECWSLVLLQLQGDFYNHVNFNALYNNPTLTY